MNARQKASIDRDNHDYGTARQRLVSLAAHSAHDPALCEEIAEICLNMKDPVEAGRWFFQCESRSEDAEQCVEMFVARYGRTATQIVAALPRRMAQSIRAGSAPQCVARRLNALGLTLREQRSAGVVQGNPWWNLFAGLGCLVAMLSVIALAIVGVVTVMNYLRGSR